VGRATRGALNGFGEFRKLRVEIGKRAIQLVAIPLIPACFQILLHTLPRKYQNLLPPAYFELRLSQLGPGIVARFQFGLLNLAFHSFAFPTSCHTPHSTAAMGIHAALFFESFRGMARVRFPYARNNNEWAGVRRRRRFHDRGDWSFSQRNAADGRAENNAPRAEECARRRASISGRISAACSLSSGPFSGAWWSSAADASERQSAWRCP